MNIFILDEDPTIAAQYNCDTHVCKIILEATQMMALAHKHRDRPFRTDSPPKLQQGLYQPRGVHNHPVSVWVRATYGNYKWTAQHTLALCQEYTNRYHKIHATQHIAEWLSSNHPFDIIEERTEFIQAMPDDVKHASPITAYRQYYQKYKTNLIRYRTNNVPHWYFIPIENK